MPPIFGYKKSKRLDQLLAFDHLMISSSTLVFTDSSTGPIGVDEVGRGCLAGPVVACAVKLPAYELLLKWSDQLGNLADSKALSAKQRQMMAPIIQKIAEWAIGLASVEEIDKNNILQASLLAMKRAVLKLNMLPKAVLLIDGNQKIPNLDGKQIPIIKGDTLSASISAASIVAKVYRDLLMCNLSGQYPQYQWQKNKGYPTQEHKSAIKRFGLSPWHRKSFHSQLC